MYSLSLGESRLCCCKLSFKSWNLLSGCISFSYGCIACGSKLSFCGIVCSLSFGKSRLCCCKLLFKGWDLLSSCISFSYGRTVCRLGFISSGGGGGKSGTSPFELYIEFVAVSQSRLARLIGSRKLLLDCMELGFQKRDMCLKAGERYPQSFPLRVHLRKAPLGFSATPCLLSQCAHFGK